MNGDQVRVLSDASADDFRQMLAIYQEAIERSEQKPASAIARLVRDPNYIVLVDDLRDIVAVITKNEFLLALCGGIFVIEALSVMAQVASFKMTGKRVFKMAPIHHHFHL